MAVLVTGLGYIGAQLAKDLLDAGSEVVAVDNLFSTDARVVKRLAEWPGFRFVRGNVGRAGVLKQAFETSPSIDVVYSLAAQSSAHSEAATPRYTENTNLLAPRLLLDAVAHYGVRTFVFASSFRVYGDELPPVVSEYTPYGRFGDLSHLSKCYVEKLMEMYAGHPSREALRLLSVRLGVVYGLSPVMKKDYRFMTAPNKFCLQAVRREKISVYGSGLRPTGFIHVADAARAMRLAVASEIFAGYTAVNAVTEMLPVSAVAEVVAEEAGRRYLDVEVVMEGEKSAAIALPRVRSRLDAMGFGPGRTIKDGVEEMLDHFIAAKAGAKA